MTQYVLSEDADRDLDGIWDYIAEDSIDAADRWIGKLFDAFDAIGATPGIGHKREDLTVYPVLFWPVGYHIIYRVTSRAVEIVAVTQGGRDIPAFLHGRLSLRFVWKGLRTTQECMGGGPSHECSVQ